MKRLFILATLFLQGGGQPVNIPIPASGWQFSAGATGYGTNGCLALPGAECFQVLSKSPADLQEYKPGYTLSGFYNVTLTELSYFRNYPGYFTVRISYGTQELCEASRWSDGADTEIDFPCTSPGYLIIDQAISENGGPATYPPQGNQPFKISISVNAGWQVTTDNVSLTFTPSN